MIRRALLGLFAIALAALGVALIGNLRVDGPAARLRRDADVLAAREWSRPVHAPPVEAGRFGDRLAELLPEIARARPSGESDPCAQYRSGGRPIAFVDGECRAQIDRVRPLFAPLARAAHAKAAGLPQAIGPLSPSAFAGGLGPLLRVAQLDALDARIDAASGRAEQALSRCVDLVALGRDLSLGAALIGRAVGDSLIRDGAQACRDALAQVHGEPRKSAHQELLSIRGALPRWSETLWIEGTVSQLMAFSPLLDERDRKALPTVGAPDEQLRPGWWERVILRDAWPRYQASWAQVAAVADEPPAVRDPALRAIAERASSSWNPVLRIAAPDLPRLLARGDQARAELDQVIALLGTD